MKDIRYLFLFVLGLFAFFSCTTDDVDSDWEEPSTENMYELSDLAFGEYLIYNAGLADSDGNKLPHGIAFKKDGKVYLDKSIAATATILYLVKDNARMKNLEDAGVQTASVKIQNLDGIQFFTSATTIRLTSNTLSGKLDLSMLPQLETLEMNSNFVNELLVPPSVTRLRYAASTAETSPDKRWLTTIDLSRNTSINHIHLPDHHLTKEGFQLPATYAELTYIQVGGNTDAPFEVPADLYNQLQTKEGVVAAATDYQGPTPKANYFAVPDLAFAEYLVFLTETESDVDIRLPEGTAFLYSDGFIYIDKAKAAGATSLNISKSGSFTKKLEEAGLSSATTKIADADGLQFFTGVQSITATSNAFTVPLKLETLTGLKSLIVRTAGLSSLDVSKNTQLEELDIQGSSKAELGRLKAVNLKTNTQLKTVNLSSNEIVPAGFILPETYPAMRSLNMEKNKVEGVEVSYTVPAALYDQLGSGSSDKKGLIRGE